MAHESSKRGGQLTPEQAREGHRWIRLTVLAAVLQAWTMITVVALLVPRLTALFLALGVAYSLAAPLLFRYLDRDIERRLGESRKPETGFEPVTPCLQDRCSGQLSYSGGKDRA